MKVIKEILFTVMLLSLCTPVISAQELVPTEQPEAVEDALFGWSSALSYEHAIVTAPQKDINGTQSVGSAYFYQRGDDGWKIIEELSPEGLPAFSNFGISTAMIWNVAAVSSFGDSDGGLFSEAVYLYEFSWDSVSFLQKLKPSGSIGSRFGYSIDFSDYEETLAVGAYQANGSESKSGAVYIFEEDSDGNWVQEQILVAEDGKSHDYFGHQVEFISDELLAIGAYNADGAAERSGAVYIFSKTEEGSWVQEAKLFDPEGSSGDLFGYSLSRPNNMYVVTKEAIQQSFGYGGLFIGAPGSNSESQSGSVYIYETDEEENWTLAHQLVENDAGNNDHFGISLAHNALNGLFVGASRTGSENAGYIYQYDLRWDFNSEKPLEKIPFSGNDNSSSADFYGSKLTAGKETPDLIFSSPYKTVNGLSNAGAAEFYTTSLSSNEPIVEIEEYKLEQNYPNPFNPTTTIKYQVKEAGDVKLTVFNLLGQTVQTLVNEKKNTGAYTVSFNASALASGFYFYRLEVNDFVSIKKMMLIK